jgi:hypothetical protein
MAKMSAIADIFPGIRKNVTSWLHWPTGGQNIGLAPGSAVVPGRGLVGQVPFPKPGGLGAPGLAKMYSAHSGRIRQAR